jgi:hypothetical protein
MDNTELASLLGEGGKIGVAAAGGFANPFADISALLGGGELIGGLLGLNKAPEHVAPTIDPRVTAMVDRSLQMAKQGYSPEQIAAYKNSVAEADTARFRHGTDMGGGNLASAVKAGINANDTNSLNKFASQDSALKEAHAHYADQSIKYLQSFKDQDWQKNETYRKGLESAFGGAAKNGLSLLTGSLGSMAAGFGKNTLPSNNPYSTTAGADETKFVDNVVDNTANQWQTNNASNDFSNTLPND